MGVVYAPYLNELFTATKGGGAYLQYASRESERLRVGEKQTLATSVIASGFPYDKDVNPDNNSDNVARIIPYVRDVRRLGSAAYDISCVAAGLLDGYWELALHEWDVCAAELILAEAGGVVCDLRRDREGNLEVRAVNSPKTKSLQALQPILNEGGSKFPPLHMCVY